MNLGLHDAVALGVVGFARRLTWLATLAGPLRPIHNAVLGTVFRLPPARRRLALRLSGLVFRPR